MKNCTLKCLLFVVAFGFIQSLFAQARNESSETTIDPYKKKGFIGINAGLSIPVGKFSNETEDDFANGYAQNGFHINYVDLGYKVTKSLAIRAAYFNNTNGIDYNQLRRNRSNLFGLNYISAEGSDYEVNGVLLGLSAIKAHKDFDLGINFLLGLSNIHIPYINLTYRDSTTNQLNEQKFSPVSKFSPGFAVGADLRIHLNAYLDFTSSIKYIIFLQKFNQEVSDQNQTAEIKFDLSYEVISPTIGIAYRFGDEK